MEGFGSGSGSGSVQQIITDPDPEAQQHSGPASDPAPDPEHCFWVLPFSWWQVGPWIERQMDAVAAIGMGMQGSLEEQLSR
jgi:hypothetical protein